jgi:hypothetical protein
LLLYLLHPLHYQDLLNLLLSLHRHRHRHHHHLVDLQNRHQYLAVDLLVVYFLLQHLVVNLFGHLHLIHHPAHLRYRHLYHHLLMLLLKKLIEYHLLLLVVVAHHFHHHLL